MTMESLRTGGSERRSLFSVVLNAAGNSWRISGRLGNTQLAAAF